MWCKFFSSLLALVLGWPISEPPAHEIFRWTDEKGTIHFADHLTSVPEPYRKASPRTQASPGREKASQISKTQVPKATMPQRYILPLTWEAGRLLVDARINDRIAVRCIVDTGANMTVIPASIAARLGYDKKNFLSIDVRGVGGIIEGRLIEVDSLKVGEAEAKNFDIIVIEDSLGGTALLGADFLSRFQMEINYTRGQMVLHSGEGPYDGYPAAWWQEKFRLYSRLKRGYEQRIRQNQDHLRTLGINPAQRNWDNSYGGKVNPLRPISDEISEHENYLRVLERKMSDLQLRANGADLPRHLWQ